MKTVTQLFSDALVSPDNPKWSRTVYYKRRYWVESTKSYTWEANWTAISEDEIQSISSISWQLDTERLNEFKTSTFDITLNNLTKKWKHSNRSGVFGPDSVSPSGYDPSFMKFQIRVALTLYDGTSETVTVFTGVATEWNENGNGITQATISGLESLLVNADAENVSTLVTNETMTGSVDGVNKDFTTANVAVGVVKEVSINGIAKRAGVDYTISQLNDATLHGKISFTNAPVGGSTIRITYRYWKTSQKFEDLVGYLCDEAGITAGNRTISAVAFPTSITNTRSFQSNVEWQTGDVSGGTDASTLTNAIQFNYKTARTWNNATTGWTHVNNSSDNGTFGSDGTGIYLQVGSSNLGHAIYRSATGLYGDWSISFKFETPSGGNFAEMTWGLIVGSIVTVTTPTIGQTPWGTALILRVQSFGGTGSDSIGLTWTDSSGMPQNGMAFVSTPVSTNVTHTIRVRRRPVSGTSTDKCDVYFDGSYIFTFTGSAGSKPTSSSYYGAYCNYGAQTSGKKLYMTTDGIATPDSTTGIGTWVSPDIDFGATPTAWGTLTKTETLGGGATTYETRTSPDGSTWDSYVATTGVIGSTLRRHAQIRITIDITNGDPYVNIVTIVSFTSSTLVTIGNFTDQTVYEAISSLAQFADYEIGFTSDEKFFFRPRSTVTTAQLSIDRRVINAVPSILTGWDRVYSKVRATYGSYQSDAEDDGQFWKSPIGRFYRRRLDIDGGNVLISADADVASGVARSFLGRYSKPRRRVKIDTKLLPQLELADILQATYDDNKPKGWYLGDTSQLLGDTSLQLYGGDQQTLYQFLGKVIGLRFDPDTWTSEIDLEEVLT